MRSMSPGSSTRRMRRGVGASRARSGPHGACSGGSEDGGGHRAGGFAHRHPGHALDARPHGLQEPLPRHVRRVRVGAAQAGADVRRLDVGVLAHLRVHAPLPPQPDRRPLPLGVLRRIDEDRPDLASGQGVPADQGAVSLLDPRALVALERDHHARRVRRHVPGLPGRRRPRARRRGTRAVPLLPRCSTSSSSRASRSARACCFSATAI